MALRLVNTQPPGRVDVDSCEAMAIYLLLVVINRFCLDTSHQSMGWLTVYIDATVDARSVASDAYALD